MMREFAPSFLALLMAAAASQLLVGNNAVAQTPVLIKALPSEAIVNQAFDCSWMLVPEAEQSAAQRNSAKAFKQLPLVKNKRTNMPDFKGQIRALGTNFEYLSGGGTMGGGFMELQGTKSSLDAVLRYFATQNRAVKQVPNPFAASGNNQTKDTKNTAQGSRSWMLSEVGPDLTLNFIVLDKFGGLDESRAAPGVSVLCFSEITNDENIKKLGLVPLAEIEAALTSNEAKPAAWADGIIASKSLMRMRRLATHLRLTAPQISALLASADRDVVAQLIANKSVLFTPAQLDALIKSPDHVDSVALNRQPQLSAAQNTAVSARASQQTKDWLVLRKRDSQAAARLMQIIDQGNQQTIMGALFQFGIPSEQHVDRLLQSRDVELRRALTMNIKFTPTPPQLEQILNDPDATVRIGLLRRDDVAIPAALVSLGINHPDKQLQFWYAARKDYVPGAAEVETGLTSIDVPERRGWLMRKNITLTQTQIDRAFASRDTRSFVAARPDVKLSAEQIEDCITDDDYTVRDTCVRRADFEINPERFAKLMRDTNPNIPETLARESKNRKVDLTPFVNQALASGSEDLAVAIGKTRALDITDAQLKAGISSSDQAIRRAFCRREQARCGAY